MSDEIKRNSLEHEYRKFVRLLFAERFEDAARLLKSTNAIYTIFQTLKDRFPTTLDKRSEAGNFLDAVAEIRYSDAKDLYLGNPILIGRGLRDQFSERGANLIERLIMYDVIDSGINDTKLRQFRHNSRLFRNLCGSEITNYISRFPELEEIVRPMRIENIPSNVQTKEFAEQARMFYEAERR